jgi:hypothetical protein
MISEICESTSVIAERQRLVRNYEMWQGYLPIANDW